MQKTLNYVILAIVCVLFIVSTVQAVEVVQMKSEGISKQAGETQPIVQPSKAAVPRTQPTMVGGC